MRRKRRALATVDEGGGGAGQLASLLPLAAAAFSRGAFA
jgi:hypothetical protein